MSEFCFYGDPLLEIMIVNPSSVRNVFIEIFKIKGRKVTVQDITRRTTMLLRQFPRVENLKLWTYIVVLLRRAQGILPNLPEFGRLTYLHLNKVRLETLIRLLHKAPLLETLFILQVTHGKCAVNDETVPLCLLSSLKVVKYGLSSGDEDELCLMKYVLENAAVLKRMVVFPSRMSDTSDEKQKDLVEKMKQVQKELLSFPKCSNVASIEFIS
ncbi:hypothetical protein L6164_022728 [Bauhinia variegata]|uniref:Uncharacterized protein n=1 Tax=Bauhinia variegata TaxID=167791 RepID=A0ACB9MGH3_BAUVA|nr:hypothetical protein L6164_022728 [Bauhinia variegata]